MIKIFPFIFILLWSSAFITTKPIIDNSDPFSALAFRFALVALGFFLFSIYSKQKILVNKKNFFESFFSGVLFHGVYLGGVFFSISKGMPTGIAALIVTLQPILTNALSGPILNEKVSLKQWMGVLLGFSGAVIVLGFDIGALIIKAHQKNIIKKGGGHKMAGGFSLQEEKISEFKDFINLEFSKIEKKINRTNNLFYDSKISPSALNENFYSEINLLSPFGSGNPEPRFVIESLELLKSSIVGEKHIKTIFTAPDGSVVKCVTFNAIKTDLETYL